MISDDSQALLQLQNINKSFPGVQALKDVTMTVLPGEIHGLLGENGAGKSTLMKILNGVYQADAGSIMWQGQAIDLNSPQAAQQSGISMIHQELALVGYLDAGKNIFLGREPHGMIPGTINWRKMYADARHILEELGLTIDVKRPVRFFSIAQRQMIEVAKALSFDARLIIMDEPTSSLTDREVETLFYQMRSLREQGVSIIFISHRLEEIFEICDRVTVLRDGQWVATSPIEELDRDILIKHMVGREVNQIYERRSNQASEHIVLEVQNLNRGARVKDISFQLRQGEILGIAGLVGAGRTEMLETIFGVHPAKSGTIAINGKPVSIRRPDQAIKQGIGFVTEDRKGQGLFPVMTVAANIAMTRLTELVRTVFVNWREVNSLAEDFIKRLDIRTPSPQQNVRNLSGGNQQKVVISRWLTLNPRVLILDEPTRGIDVGAKSEIYRLIQQLAADGVGIIMASSELPEILGVSDRVLVMHEGRFAGEFDPKQATQDDLMVAATGTYQEGCLK
ncbi:MAG: sugar ABC transporter ATP-binding protein [Anaerolineae bacterium]|nr:sugar ABC transporter ATP-binding protein [Anaerolineae bacterium]